MWGTVAGGVHTQAPGARDCPGLSLLLEEPALPGLQRPQADARQGLALNLHAA